VTAGTVVFEAPITVRASSTGAGSTLAGIGRLVVAAQAREAPMQRLADTIAGRFCFSVMAVSAATFAFWSTLGALANSVSLVSKHMQCPCAASQGVCICLLSPSPFQFSNFGVHAGLLLPSLFAVC
jgi:cation transport ATPase